MRLWIFASIFAIFFTACGTKREYFSPAQIDEKAKIQSLSAKILSSTRNGATLGNGRLITNDGEENIIINKNEQFLGKYEEQYIVSDITGKLRILDSSGNLVFEKQFLEAILSASLEGNLLALLSASNKIYLILVDTDEIILEYASGPSYAQDAKTAAPLFLNTIIIYPTLDGKVMVVQKDRGVIVRDAVVSSEAFFNNVIYLDISGEKLYAATHTKILSIAPDKTTIIAEDLQDIKLYKDKIYVLLKNGIVKIYNLDLQELASKEFEFAIFSNIIAKNDKIYIFEKTGYIIQTDLELQNEKILKASKITNKSFASQNGFYYDNKMINVE